MITTIKKQMTAVKQAMGIYDLREETKLVTLDTKQAFQRRSSQPTTRWWSSKKRTQHNAIQHWSVQQTWAHNQWQSHHTIIYTTGVLRLTRVDLVLAVVMLWEFENAVAESADGLERSVLRVGEVVQSQQWTAAVSKRSLQQLEYLHNACQIHADHHLANWVSANTASTISRRLLGDIQDAFF